MMSVCLHLQGSSFTWSATVLGRDEILFFIERYQPHPLIMIFIFIVSSSSSLGFTIEKQVLWKVPPRASREVCCMACELIRQPRAGGWWCEQPWQGVWSPGCRCGWEGARWVGGIGGWWGYFGFAKVVVVLEVTSVGLATTTTTSMVTDVKGS